MAITTITQPTFIVDNDNEKSTSWPNNSFVWVKATNMLWTLKSGVWVNVSAAINYDYYENVKKFGVFAWSKAGVTTSGSATFYLTDDGTAAGNALYTEIHARIAVVGSADNAWIMGYTTSPDMKSITVTVQQRVFSNTTILGISVLATATLSNAPNNTPLTLFVFGK